MGALSLSVLQRVQSEKYTNFMSAYRDHQAEDEEELTITLPGVFIPFQDHANKYFECQ